jgi:predicted lactoylglutathione lyase
MKKNAISLLGFASAFCFGFVYKNGNEKPPQALNSPIVNVQPLKLQQMKLGAFSVSLNVKDLTISKQFYEHLGFSVYAGDMAKNFLIMKNGDTIIGLFYGMFEETILTFNPGWDQNAAKMEAYDDIREIQKQLKQKGIKAEQEVDETTTGPASFVITDPDGNVILFDQHI